MYDENWLLDRLAKYIMRIDLAGSVAICRMSAMIASLGLAPGWDDEADGGGGGGVLVKRGN